MPSRIYRFGDFTLSTLTRELRRNETPIPLSPRAFDCLVHLIERRERAVNKDELVAAIWRRPNVSDTQLGQTVLRARRALGDDGQTQHYIRTVSRYGYRWIADVTEAADTAAAADEIGAPTQAEGAAPIVESPVHELAATRTVSPAPIRRRHALVLACALAIIAVLTGAFVLRRLVLAPNIGLSEAQAGTSAIVLPLRIDASADHAWLRLGGMDLIAERLRSGGLTLPPSESVVALLQSVKDADDASTLQTIRQAAPTALIISGRLARAGQGWTTELRAVTADGATLNIESALPDALDTARDAADRLLGRLGRSHPPEVPLAGGLQERLQRAQAAMLGNDLDAARAILISDPQVAREEPQLGYRLAQVDFRAGEYARAETALTALLAEPAADDPLFHARLLNVRGAVHIRQDDYAAAADDYDAAIALLRGGGHAPELGLALTGRGVTHAMRHDFAPALADLGEARVQLEASGDALAVARVDSNLGGLEMNRDRPEQALGYLESAAERFERYGAINELMETLASLFSDHMALLQPAEALAVSDRSWALAGRVSDPNQRLNLMLDRIDAFLALGRLREAGALLGTLPETAPGANHFVARRLPALRARLALAEGRPADAADAARRALALAAPTDDSGEGVAEIALIYQRAMLASSPAPTTPPAEAWVPLRAASTYPVQALLKAEWADAQGDGTEAARLFRAALDLAEQRGIPADVALVTTVYGPWLLRQGRVRDAGEIIGRVSPWASRDFDCALLPVRLFHALRQADAWSKALTAAKALAGERVIPAELQQPPA